MAVSQVVGRLRHQWQLTGPLATVRFVGSRLFRYQITRVYEADLRGPLPAAEWRPGERLEMIGPENLEDLTPAVRRFLGGAGYECVAGIPRGDRLFLVASGEEYLHRGYVMAHSRTKRLIGEQDATPLIGYCYTAPTARGTGLYRRALLAELLYLQQAGYTRVAIDTHPDNYPSRKGIEAAGFTFLRTVSVWIVLSLFAIRRTEGGDGTRWRIVIV